MILTAAPGPPPLLKLLADDLRWKLVSALARSDLRVQELVALAGERQNLVSYHLRRLRDEHLVAERRSSADRRDVYYSLDLDRLRQLYLASGAGLHPALADSGTDTEQEVSEDALPPTRVLFLCTHNSARSQMAEALLRHYGKGKVEVFSAGSEPSHVNPYAVRVMAARGIDISQASSKHLDQYRDQHFDYVITVCDRARDACPVLPGAPEQIHWSFPDPAAVEGTEAEKLRAFEETARQLTTRIQHLMILIDRERRG